MTERQVPAGRGGPPYGMLRAGLRTGAVDWILARVPTLRRNPFALGYLAVVGATTTFAGLADPELVLRLQEASSSDGHNLLQHPLRALLFSGFWVAGPVWMPYLWAFALTVAPLERRVGPGRAAVVFAAGHITATLLSQGVVVVAVASGRLEPAAMDYLDIGVSYGVLASLGGLAGLLRPAGRAVALALAVAMIADQIAADRDLVTGVGHPVALLVGVALWRWLRRWEGHRPRRAPFGLPAELSSRPAPASPARRAAPGPVWPGRS